MSDNDDQTPRRHRRAPPDDVQLPPPPPLGNSRPELLTDRLAGLGPAPDDVPLPPPPLLADRALDDAPVPLPPPPALGDSRPERLGDRSAGRESAPEGVPVLPPPPPLGNSRPERLADRFPEDHPPRGRGGAPEEVRLPPHPQHSKPRPEHVVYRLESDSPIDGTSPANTSPGESRRSRPRSQDVERRRSPPRRSRSPVTHKRVRRDDVDGDGRRRRSRWSSPRRSWSPVSHKRVRRDDGDGRRRPSRWSLPRRSWSPVPHNRIDAAGRYVRRGGSIRFGGPRLGGDMPDSGSSAASFNSQDINLRKGLMTYKQFTQILEDDVSPANAESRYQDYKTSYISTQKRTYFDLHKDEDWLRQKYHPTDLLSVIGRRNEFCKAAAKNLILDLRDGNLDTGPGMTADASSKSGNKNNGSSEDGKKRMNARDPPKETGQLSTAPKAHPVSSKYGRIRSDVYQTLALVKKLDEEKGIGGNILTADYNKSDDEILLGKQALGPMVLVRAINTVRGLEGIELLDTLLTYLWRVHGVDYYGMSEMKDPKGFRHARTDDKSASAYSIKDSDWENKLDSFWNERINGQDHLIVLTAKDRIDAATDEALQTYVRKFVDEKQGCTYGCGAKGCLKVFHAPDFVHKHLKLKHPDLISMLNSRVKDDIYFQNYMNDPDAPGGVPVMQQSASERKRGAPDEEIFGAFDTQGSNASFLLESFPPTPTLLIPVPGAGPLGPFVPAPPDIAEQMMLPQGLSRPKGDGLLGKKPVMLPMYPNFPPDPRPLRSYNDLDAPDPEEEVNAMDYRSL